jgi:hypothetical protein
MLLILTNSLDGTVDLLMERLGDYPVFRFNIDLWSDYRVWIEGQSFRIEDPVGRCIEEKTVRSCYWRKPRFDDNDVVPSGGSLNNWLKAQWRYVVRDLWNVCRQQGKARLVELSAEPRFGKIMQLRAAKRHFLVPDWSFVKGEAAPVFDGDKITKAFDVELIGDGKVFYSKKVQSGSLNPDYPWLLQDEVQASHDLTVVYVAGRCFGFTLDRRLFDGVDWRVDINRVEHPWEHFELGDDLTSRICAFMDEAKLSYGRLDFLLMNGMAWFLEVNPNGQYAWLDQDGKQGMIAAIIEELTTNTPRRPIAPW